MKPWQKYLIAFMLAVFLLWAISRFVRPKAYGIPISNVIARMKGHWLKRYDSRGLEEISGVIIHHSLTKGGTARAFSEYHVEENGWAGIGYHYVIYKDGRIEQTQYLRTVSWHTSGVNRKTIGICLVGNYDQEEAPQEQLASTVKLIAYLQDRLGKQLTVEPHNRYSSKSCPGAAINVNEIRSAVREFKKVA